MLDFSKPLGTFEGVVFYGDHEQTDLAYYLPDEVKLSQVATPNTNDRFFDLNLQIYKDARVIEGPLENLNQSVGSFLSLGVECTVDEKRLEKARKQLADSLDIEDNKALRLTTPPWKKGKVDLIVLDATTQDEDSFGENSFVRSVIGTRHPSLQTSDLKSIFNVHLNRRGTALVAAALQGDVGHIAGVIYEMEFIGLRPALDLRIHANLSRIHKKIGHYVSLDVSYPGIIGVGHDFEFIKQKMEEEGDIVVEVLSQAEDAETQALIRRTINEFKDKVMEKLFQPVILPTDVVNHLLEKAGGKKNAQPNIVQLGYRFRSEKNFYDRVIEIDYRERTPTTRIHNPQAHLWKIGEHISEQLVDYTQVVDIRDVWREQKLKLSILHDFTHDDNDLLNVEVRIWPKSLGVRAATEENQFSNPLTGAVITTVNYSKLDTSIKQYTWFLRAEEEIGYYYQMKFFYFSSNSNISTPAEIISKVYASNSEDLVIIPRVLTPMRQLEFKLGNLNLNKVSGVDVHLRAKNEHNQIVDAKIVRLNRENREEVWKLRRPLTEGMIVEEQRTYYFHENKPSLTLDSIELLDDELIVNDPFDFNSIQIIPVIVGANEAQLREVLLNINYSPPNSDYTYRQLFRASAPRFFIDEISVKVLYEAHSVQWEASAVDQNGRLFPIGTGSTQGGAIILDLKPKTHRELTIEWVGDSPENEDLNYLRLEFRLRHESGEVEKLPKLEFKGEVVESPKIYRYALTGALEMKVTKRYLNGRKERSDYEVITEEKISVGANI